MVLFFFFVSVLGLHSAFVVLFSFWFHDESAWWKSKNRFLLLYFCTPFSMLFGIITVQFLDSFHEKKQISPLLYVYMCIYICTHFTSTSTFTVYYNFIFGSPIPPIILYEFFSVIIPFIVVFVVRKFLVAFHVWNNWIRVCVLYMLVTSLIQTTFTVNFRTLLI